MKVTQEHYQTLKQAIANISPEKVNRHREQLKGDHRVHDVEKRLRWDLMYAAGLTQFLCSTLYKYANDDHIDTALKQAMKEIFGVTV